MIFEIEFLCLNDIIFVTSDVNSPPFCLITSTQNDKILTKPISFNGSQIRFHEPIQVQNSHKYTLDVRNFDPKSEIAILKLKKIFCLKKCAITQQKHCDFMYATFQAFIVRCVKAISLHIRENSQGIRENVKALHGKICMQHIEFLCILRFSLMCCMKYLTTNTSTKHLQSN